MPRELKLITPENVEVHYALAGIGSRLAAAVLDAILQLLVLLAIVVPLVLISGGFSGEGADLGLSGLGIGLAVLLIVLLFLFFVGGYYLFFETLWNGQTPGKRAMGLRVVQENGRPVDFFTSAARNVLRLVDMLPAFYLVGLASIFFSPRYKRLGDYVAGTLVIKEYRPQTTPFRGQDRVSTGEEQGDGAPPEVDGLALPRAHLITREDYEIARRLLSRRGDLPPDTEARLTRQIALPLMQKAGYTPNGSSEEECVAFLEELTRSFLRRDSLHY